MASLKRRRQPLSDDNHTQLVSVNLRGRRPAYSNLMKQLEGGTFTYTGELEPKKITSIEKITKSAAKMKPYVIAANVTDGPQGDAYISSIVPSYLVQHETGLETINQMCTRDRNRNALFGDVMAAAMLGIKNILVLTGDHSALGDNAGAKPVYDLDSAQFCYMLSKLIDDGVDLGGNGIKGKLEMNFGAVVNPNSDPMEPEILKLERKVNCGVDFIQTQTVFDIDRTKEFLKECEYLKVPILVGLFPMKNYGIADYFDKYIPGVSVPKEVLANLKKTKKKYIPDKKERNAAVDAVNLEFFTPFIKEIKKTTKAAGIHCMAVEYERLFKPLLDRVEGG
ncbi:MAG: methylenetetrahydrofolate reductase [Promethearchaeota archaeon]